MGFFDRFRRSSKPEPEPEKPTSRSSGSGSSSLGASKLTRGSSSGGSQPDQELLDAIAAIWDGKESGLDSSAKTPVADKGTSADSSSDGEADLAKALSLLMGEKPEPKEEDDESESTYEQDVNDAIDDVVGLMGALNPDLKERIRQYAEETQGRDTEPEPKPEPETTSESGPDEDLLASIASLMGQDSSDSKPVEETAPAENDNTDDLLSSISSLIGQGPAEPEPEPEPEPASDDNPFSAIAALMEQDSSDPEPPDEPAPAGDGDGGDDLLSSIAALMGGSMYASDQNGGETPESPSAPATPEIDPALEEQYLSLCAEGDRYLDEGALETALFRYLTVGSVCGESEALKGMAFHHAAALELHQAGCGLEAASFARDGLECGEAFRLYAKEHRIDGQPDAYMETLQIAALTSTSYDEALEYANQGVELYGDDFGPMADELQQYRAEHPRFADWQRSESLKHYSRVSAEEDKGDYAPAMVLLDTILRNANEDTYRLSYEEQAQMLDDYGTISIMHMLGKARSTGLSQDDFAIELSFIADGALSRIADFLPECQPADKPKIDRIIQGMKMLPGVSERIAFEPFR